MKVTNKSKKKGIMYWRGANTAFCCNWGASKGIGWAIAPLVYMLKEALLPVISIPLIQKPQCAKKMILNRNISLHNLQNRNTKVSTAISWNKNCWSLATKFSWCCQIISIYETKLTSFAFNSGLDGPVFLLEPCIPGGISTSRLCFGPLCFRLLRLLP